MAQEKGRGQKSQFTFTLRRTRIWFVVIILVTTLAIVWPGYQFFSSAEPLVAGFPLSFAWMILWVIIGFAAMMWLYLSDRKHEAQEE